MHGRRRVQSLVRRIAGFLLLFPVACGGAGEAVDPLGECSTELQLDVCDGDAYDLDWIVETGKLRVALASDPTSWFLDGSRVRGFEHDLLAGFARSKGLELQLFAEPTVEGRLAGLREGRYDVVAGRLQALAEPGIAYVPVSESRRVVVQTVEDVNAGLAVEDPEDLVLHVVRVVDLSGNRVAVQDLGLGVDLEVYADGTLLETLVDDLVQEGGALVARADLVEPLVDEHNLVIGPALPGVSGAQLGVREGALALRYSLENWLEANERTVERARERYIEARVRPRRPQVSAYDPLFRSHATRIDWSWTLLAAQAWKESRFEPGARSPAGALGLMQIMPATAGELGIEDPGDPEQSVRGAASYLRRLDRYYAKQLDDPDARLPFVLAAYNAGMGHVDDARRLAEANGHDSASWDAVAPWMLALADRTWNRHPVVRNGYCRGTEPVAYVEDILNRRDIYEALLVER
ncbi:MAG: transglycosylase SLT domain-containing protein [Alphaproteobacteria bacterium]|nr:transglycosylase SLT domain-containing protein [Alphaproteobacteria bacterium]